LFCWYWCEWLTITALRRLFALLTLVWIFDHHWLEVIVHFVDIGVNCWTSLFRGYCSLCWYWCELLTITGWRWLFALLILVEKLTITV
jgi:hypothetical protein